MSAKDSLGNDNLQNGGDSGRFLQEFYLPVHGFVRLEGAEVAIVNHPTFQRLRKCRQLGLAHVVFPGATHTRFEHSIGAVYAAEQIISSVNANAHSPKSVRVSRYSIHEISDNERAIIRLGALLHDIGHIPLGHTLEDELEHLEKHDGEARVDRIADKKYKQYVIDPSLEFPGRDGGWSLRELVDTLYAPVVDEIFGKSLPKLSAYEVLKLVTLKAPPKEAAEEKRKQWNDDERALSNVFPTSVCRDIIGNTICADFLDYLFRDWYHVGKPIAEDKRLYQYMEVRGAESPSSRQFVINVGPDQKLRHDALTCIFELLQARYKLAETVLFHRTKLAMIALLDRCFLELRHLYMETGLRGRLDHSDAYLSEQALNLLLEGSDDDIPGIILRLADGVTEKDKTHLRKAASSNDELVARAVGKNKEQSILSLPGDGVRPFNVADQQALIRLLVGRFEQRTMYTLAQKLPLRKIDRSDADRGPGDLAPPALEMFRPLAKPEERWKLIAMMEARFHFPKGSVTLYAPPTAKMNAKIAGVKLLIGGKIKEFAKYESEMGEQSQTGGLLLAQVKRFYELWGISVYVDRPIWYHLDESLRRDISHWMRRLLYLDPDYKDRTSEQRKEMEGLLKKVRGKMAARDSLEAEDVRYSNEIFPSGIPFANPDS